ncbi:hypothetical protein C0J52_15529 [Blattella germanica]|nr:hypothetical protein C0J52_15529 [Blattella germanica]
MEDLRLEVLLPSMAAYENVIKELKQKRQQIWSSFYTPTAMTSNEWRRVNYDLGHSLCSIQAQAVHPKEFPPTVRNLRVV